MTVRPWHVQMSGRDPTEPHRASTPLELLFDLCFVVAVAQVAGAFHHEMVGGHVIDGLFGYLIVFWVIWWAWVNFTWFASAYDTDDVIYRLLAFAQIAGVLVVAAGVPPALEVLDFATVVVGFVIMRLALVVLWLRAAREDPDGRRVALRFAAGVGIVQLLWVARLAIDPPIGTVLILVLGVFEMLIPWWAERSGRPTPWNSRHIAERYGLFTIIVLGEVVLAATTAIQAALTTSDVLAPLVVIAVGGLLTVFAMWWSYFKAPPAIEHLHDLRLQIFWGYGHYFIFAAIAAVGAGLQIVVDAVVSPGAVAPAFAAATVAVPTAIYFISVTVLHSRGHGLTDFAATAVGVLALLATIGAGAISGAPLAILVSGVIASMLVGWYVIRSARAARVRSPATG